MREDMKEDMNEDKKFQEMYEKLMDYAKSTGKPIMAHPEEEQIQDKYMQLYNSLTE